MLVKVNERGTWENFVLKCTERLCGAAQLEIMDQTKLILDKYIEKTKNDNEEIYDEYLYIDMNILTYKKYLFVMPFIFSKSRFFLLNKKFQ